MKSLFLLFAVTFSCFSQTTVLFQQPLSPDVSIFPSDAFTAVNASQKTGKQIDLPLTSCLANPNSAACQRTVLLNQLDGFSLNARSHVCFSAPINPNTLKTGIWYIPLDSLQLPIPINQVLYEPSSNCAYFKPDRVLNQSSHYLLVVSRAVRDTNGNALRAAPAFTSCMNGGGGYCASLAAAMRKPEALLEGAESFLVAGASVFTTLSATTWLEQARDFVDSHQPAGVLPAGNSTAFSLAAIKSITYLPQDNQPTQTQINIPLNVLSNVDRVAFGLYFSPNFLSLSGPLAGSIPMTPTNEPIAAPTPIPGVPPGTPPGYEPVSFHAWLPSASKLPAGGHGFPVVIYGHGLGDNQFGAPTFIASTLAANGFATLAIEITGHGFGPGGTVKITNQDGTVATVATPGRGISFSPGAPIGATDGCILPGPLAVRDCNRQTAVDLFALVQTIRETNGLGMNLDPDRIYYVGQSLGAIYGTLADAVDPHIRAAVFNGDGAPFVDDARLALSGRPLGNAYLSTDTPSLLNVPPAQPEAYFHDAFNDNYVYRDTPVMVNTVPGALDVQSAFETAEWLNMPGDPLSFAPHLKTAPLSGVPAKNILFQFAFGDLEVSNPMNAKVIRAANATLNSWYFRFDRAVASHPELLGVTYAGVGFPILPHRILSNPTIFDPTLPAENSITFAEQQQVASYFAADGRTNPDPNQFLANGPYSGERLFEIPLVLPNSLNFLQLAP